MNDLPAPLTPPECDLRGMEWMPLHGHKLYGSDFDAIANDAEYRAAQRLWWAAWQQQVPAASLPDDDRVLSNAAGYKLDQKGWKKIKEVALHAFVKCSDGRLYHRFLAPEAIIAWEKRVKERQRKADYRAKKDGTAPTIPQDVPRDKAGTGQSKGADQDGDFRVDNTTQDNTGQDNLRKKEEEPSLIPPRSPEPLPKAAALRTSKKKPRYELPDGWTPNEEGRALAASKGLHLADTIARFTAYHRGEGNIKASWNGAWATWCLSPYNAPKTAPSGTAPKPTSGWGAQAQQVAELFGDAGNEPPIIDGEF